VVDVSLFATAAWTMASDLAPTLVDGAPVRKRDRHHLITPLGNRFRCRDDRWIILNMPEVRWWAPFCKTIERPELLDDDRFSTVKDRFDNMPALIDLLDEVMATRTLAEWGQIMDDAGFIWGPASSIDELCADPQAEAIGLFPTIEHPEGDFRTVAAPMHISGAEIRPRGPAPAIGADTLDVLSGIGYTQDEVAALTAAGIVGHGATATD
jgi:crotonobetainyl-CoA:carnitine CoA-transferase CaiB-like acyl-CoA transferase